MKVVALVSGGKDSCYAMMKCLQYGHEVVALANLLPADDAEDELDSYMYQTVGHQIVVCYAKCMGLPLFRRRILGSTRNHGLSYSTTPGDEVEDMFILLNEVKLQIPSVTAVSSGAIASDYQRLRVESVCSRLGLVSLAYLWKQDQRSLLRDMIEAGIIAITVKVASMGLNPSKHLGKEMSDLESYLHKLNELYGINVCGEGGEYETLTLDCPLFTNARIVLDDFQVILHSSDPISPVGILHPLAFHLKIKMEDESPDGDSEHISLCLEELDLVREVQGDSQQIRELSILATGVTSPSLDVDESKPQISKTRKNNIFSLSCWLQDSYGTSADMQVDLELVLGKIESQLAEHGYSWENVLYIHLYINDMNKFGNANETYVKFITQEKCRFGVPSRSTIELPLVQVGLGMAYMEVLVADDETKRVLHVQSISCWAPSCIGPYSQATLHKDILYMAGQLGLDPPTMLLSSGGPTTELERALENGEAVAKCFNCSMYTSAVVITIYCSKSLAESDRIAIENRSTYLLKDKKLNNSEHRRSANVLDPVLLYILVPDLPKRALVEIKPVLYTGETIKNPIHAAVEDISTETPGYWDFKYEDWHAECIQQCFVPDRLCSGVISVKQYHAEKICSTSLLGNENTGSKTLSEEQIKQIARFIFFHLDRILLEAHFTWDDATSLRIHAALSLSQPLGTLSRIFTSVFDEFARLSQKMKTTTSHPLFNIVPVLGAGRSAASMDDILTCELLSTKS